MASLLASDDVDGGNIFVVLSKLDVTTNDVIAIDDVSEAVVAGNDDVEYVVAKAGPSSLEL